MAKTCQEVFDFAPKPDYIGDEYLNGGIEMMLRFCTTLLLILAVASCTTTPSDPNAQTIFRIRPGMADDIQLRHIDSVNALREAQGLPPLQLSSALTAAAKTHALDMSRQARPWHFGSDGSSPLDRVARTGYSGAFLSENLSESFESDLETLEAWMRDPVTRKGILSPEARYLGISWHQEPVGKIWWVQVIGS